MQQTFAKYRGRADFLTIYIREAHPEDGWQVPQNKEQNVCYMTPKTLAQRIAIANDFIKRFDYKIPLVVDDIENHADAIYAAWPERLYVIDERGVIVFKNRPGPFGFHPEELETFLAKRFGAS